MRSTKWHSNEKHGNIRQRVPGRGFPCLAYVIAVVCCMPCFCLAQDGVSARTSINPPAVEGLTESPDRVFLDSLLESGLFRLAETYCMEKLNSPDVSQALKAELTIEWMRVVMGRSQVTTEKEQHALRENAKKILEDFRMQYPNSSWLSMVEYQWGIGLLATAQRMCLEGLMREDEARLEESRKMLRQVIQLFKNLDKTLETMPQHAPQKKAGRTVVRKPWAPPEQRNFEDGLSVWESVSLRNNLQYRLLLALQCQAESYPAGSSDRALSLEEALKQVQVLWGIPEHSRLMWDIRLAEIACLRLQENYTEVQKRLEALRDKPMSEESRMDLLAETIRLYLASGRLDDALTLVQQEYSEDMIGFSGNMDCAVLEMQIAFWMRACGKGEPGRKEADRCYADTLIMREKIREKCTLPWVYRAEILLSKVLKDAASQPGMVTQDLGVMLMMVENACLSGDLKTASAQCEKAWRLAVTEENVEVAVKVGVLAASVQYQLRNIPESLRYYRQTALTFPEHPDAIKNHRTAIYLAGQLTEDALARVRDYASLKDETPSPLPAAAGTGEPPPDTEVPESQPDTEENTDTKSAEDALLAGLNAAMDLYEQLLAEHYSTWKDKDPQRTLILKQLDDLVRLRGKHGEAVDISRLLVAETDPDDSEYFARIRSAVTAWNSLFQSLQKQPAKMKNLPDYAREAVAWCESLLKTLTEEAERCELTLQMARWRLEYLPQTAEQAEERLRAVLVSERIPAEMRVSAQCLLILATVMQGRSDQVSEMLVEITQHSSRRGSAGQDTRSLLAILQTLQRFSKTATDSKTAQQYAELQLTVVELLQKNEASLSPADRNSLLTGKAQTLMTLGRSEEALPLYEKIAAKYPKNRTFQTEYAHLLGECGEKKKDIALLKQAQTQWRAVEKHSTPKSEAWFTAKYEVIRLYLLLNDKENARRVYDILRVLYPDLGGTAMKRKFERLFSG